jgi:hypothetical protein
VIVFTDTNVQLPGFCLDRFVCKSKFTHNVEFRTTLKEQLGLNATNSFVRVSFHIWCIGQNIQSGLANMKWEGNGNLQKKTFLIE